MKTVKFSILYGFLFCAGFATSAAAVNTATPAAKSASPFVLFIDGAIGRICQRSATDGQIIDTTCKPFTIPQAAVMGSPIEITPPTTRSRAWISIGDPAAQPQLVYAAYGWQAARSIPIRATIPEGFSLSRIAFGKPGQGLQFTPHSKTSFAGFTTDGQFAAMQKFRAALRVAVIAAITDMGKRSHKNTRIAGFWDCDLPGDNLKTLTTGGGQLANLSDSGNNCGGSDDPGGFGGQGGGGAGGGDGGGVDDGGGGFAGDGGGNIGGGDTGGGSTMNGSWTESDFDDFADRMVESDFDSAMVDFAAGQAFKPRMACSKVIQQCTDVCSTVRDLSAAGCTTLGGAAAVFLTPTIGAVVTFYCGTKIALATAVCNHRCQTPTVACDN